ncbi:MAG TPA: acyl-CoA dehydrogenase family protein, partial [Acidimicrobiia bacterium]|nr:acyl-CoA dehydrogenase family protein [Acidimicrobiia bacterium]
MTTPEELADVRRLVREFGAERVRPRIRDLEEAGTFPRELYREMGQLGFFGCIFPEDLGGTGLGFRALAIVAEELAYAYPPLSACMNLQAATVPLTIQRWGTPEVVERYVPGLVGGELIGYNAMSEPDGGT